MSLDVIWSELIKRGTVRSDKPQSLGIGNIDRRSHDEKSLFRIVLPEGSAAKLTIGPDLSGLISRSRSWAQNVPEIACKPVADLRIHGFDILIETFFFGEPLDEVVIKGSLPFATIHHAVAKICEALARTRKMSSAKARETEWETWTGALSALKIWQPEDITFLRDQLLPALKEHFFRAPPETQWIHGDLTGRNILLSAVGEPCLIDLEFAESTHFFSPEAARFHAFSAAAREQPGVFTSIWPVPDVASQIHFWLNQVFRETIGNTSDYNDRWLPQRLGVVRQLAQQLLQQELKWHPANAPVPETPLLETAQLFLPTSGGWEESNSAQIHYPVDRSQTLFFRVSSEAQYWRFDPSASELSAVIQRVSFHSADYELVQEYEGSQLHRFDYLALGDTNVQIVPDGLRVSAASGDPQLAITEPRSNLKVRWLEIQVRRPLRENAGSLMHRLEECRWVDQPSRIAVRVSGWCLSSDGSELLGIEAHVRGQKVASSLMLLRSDVQEHHGKTVALFSGFLVEIPSIEPFDFIKLVAIPTTGDRMSFELFQAGDLPNCGPIIGDYPTWAKIYDPDPPSQPSEELPEAIRFSILLPVFDTPARYLRECIASVRNQTHNTWELCIVDDASPAPHILPILADAAHADSRIHVKRRSVNAGIACATNDALAVATGEYVVMLDHDDLLRPHALSELSKRILADRAVDVIYSDEDKITADGHRIIPFFKPSFSPEYLLGVMYPGHVMCVRSKLARQIGGFDSEYDGIQDFEFLLRLSEHTQRIVHLPKILYHWRQSPTSSALQGNVKGDMDRKQLSAVRAHLRRRSDSREVSPLGRHRLRISTGNTITPRTAVILAWKPQPLGAPECDWGQLQSSEWRVYLSPNLTAPAGLISSQLPDGDWTKALQHVSSVGDFDIIVVFTVPPLALTENFLSELSSLAARPDSGCVAPLILAREGHVFESGCALTSTGSHSLMRGFDPVGDGYNGSLLCSREVDAVSPVCFAIRSELLGNAPDVATKSWIDFCLSLSARGSFHRVCAHARVHIPLSWRHENLADASTSAVGDTRFFNPNFDQISGDYSLAWPPRLSAENRAVFIWYLDTPPPPIIRDGCLTLRGWCFRPDRQKVVMKVSVAGLTWSAGCFHPRPDVAETHPGMTNEACGFTFHLRLPPGLHTLDLHAIGADGATEQLLQNQRISVPRTAAIRRWMLPRDGSRISFQLMATPSDVPRSILVEKFPTRRKTRRPLPRFTIVTPSYEQGRFLGETIRSVIDQPGVHCDYLVQDGGSSDTSIEVIRRHADRLTGWESAPDGGQSDAISRAFARTTSGPEDVMSWINSDDFYMPGTLPYVADFFARHPNVDVVYGHRVVVDENSHEVGRWFLPPHDPEVLRLNDYVPQETVFWRRRIWDRVGGIDASFKFALDWDLLLRFQSAGARIVRLPYFLACFRIHPAQKTSAQMESIGQREIDALRLRSFGHRLSPTEIENHPQFIKYVRKSAWIEFLWRRFRIRHP